MNIRRGTNFNYEVVDQKRNALLKSDSFTECQEFLAKNTEGLIYSARYGACLTQVELNRRGGQSASTEKTKKIT